MNIEYTPRDKNIDISNFLNESLKELESLDYYIEESFSREDLAQILDEDLPSTNASHQKMALVNDITSIAANFFSKTHTKKIRIQLQLITDNMCRLFHMDNNTQRLLCTFKGAGTQWLEEDNLNRSWLGKGDNNKIVKDFDKVKKANEFDILILKGNRYSESIDGAVHRSPPINEEKQTRVLLKIDEYSAIEYE